MNLDKIMEDLCAKSTYNILAEKIHEMYLAGFCFKHGTNSYLQGVQPYIMMGEIKEAMIKKASQDRILYLVKKPENEYYDSKNKRA